MNRKPEPCTAFELVQSHFDQLLDPSYRLILLANKIYRRGMDAAFLAYHRPEIGALAKAVRLMVGLRYCQYTFSESDDSGCLLSRESLPAILLRLHEPEAL